MLKARLFFIFCFTVSLLYTQQNKLSIETNSSAYSGWETYFSYNSTTSIAEGVKNIQSADVNVTGIIIIPADMPLIDYNAIQAFFTAHPKFPQSIIQAVDDNGPGHPVLFPRQYFKDLITVSYTHLTLPTT